MVTLTTGGNQASAVVYNKKMTNSLRSLFLLEPDVIFLNHGSFGACPKPVFEAYQEWQRRLELQPVRFVQREQTLYQEEARAALSSYIHCDPKEVACILNVTHGVNIVARSLVGNYLQAGDEVLTTDHEYGSCNTAWEYLCKKAGVRYVYQHIPLPISSAEEISELFWTGVTPRTKLIYLSHITSPTALRLPVEAICERARQAGILTVIDGAHAPGQLPLDMQAIGADFYTGNCHKWMLSPKGAGFLYVRLEQQKWIEPLVVNWGYRSTAETSRGSRLIDYVEWTGTHDPAASLSVPRAIQFMEEHEWIAVRESCHNLLGQTIQKISEMTGLRPAYPPASDLYSQMGIAPIPAETDTTWLKNQLYDQYRIEVPAVEWNGQKMIRISVQAYNTPEDLDALIEALQVELPRAAPRQAVEA